MVDYSDNELDSKIEGMLALDCHPTHFNLTADFDKIVGKSSEEKEALNLQRYYASELIGIEPDENPPYNILDKIDSDRTPNEVIQFIDFGTKISSLLNDDDICDKEGIKFIAHFLAHYDSSKGQINSLASHIRGYIAGVLSYNAKIVDIAKETLKEINFK